MPTALIMTANDTPAPLKHAIHPWDAQPATQAWNTEQLKHADYDVALVRHRDLYAARLFAVPGRTIITRVRRIIALTDSQIAVEQRLPGGLAHVRAALPAIVAMLPGDTPQPLPLTAPPPPEPQPRTVNWQTVDDIAAYLHEQTASNPTTPDPNPPLSEAVVIVAAGKGLGFAHQPDAPASIPEKIQHAMQTLIRPLAHQLGGAAAASRAAIDTAALSTSLQVGQSGRSVTPDAYIAAGISGAPQHIQGMHLSRTVIAINNDTEAPIFKYADYGLVGDAAEELSALLTALEAKANS